MNETTEFTIRLVVEGDPEAAQEGVEAALDVGVLQDYVNDCLPMDQAIHVKSAVIEYAKGPRKLTLEDVKQVMTAEHEDCPITGQFDLGEPERDRELEREISARLDGGDVWAWFCAKVEVRWEGFTGTSYLGCCSYASEEDFRQNFRQSGYYEGMVREALDDLNCQIHDVWSQIAPLRRSYA